ncbi:MAG: NADH-quinone oxidoreductase subunit M [Armatimonadetes bacterium]|nr:NADH-quinone oxidoreductase subunit M [Armatimonadota bacterium]
MFPILSVIVLAPLAGAAAILLLSGLHIIGKENQAAPRAIALASTVISFLGSIWVAWEFYQYGGGGILFEEPLSWAGRGGQWLAGLGASYHLGVNGISASMVLLSGILGFVAVIASWNIKERMREYFTLVLVALCGVFGVFATLDLFFFFLFYEMASIPMYFLVGMWGSSRKDEQRTVTREYAAMKLLLYLQLGGAMILVGALGMYFGSSARSFDMTLLARENFPVELQRWLFPLLFLGFGIEAGFWPFHTWLPDGHSAAPTALSMLLAGVLLKMGGYGMVRVAMDLLPDGAAWWLGGGGTILSKVFIFCALINILYGALCAMHQKDIKYIIAYSSISHMGIVTLGFASRGVTGINGAVFQMFSHGVITALLFALAGLIYEKSHTRDITQHGGLAARMPILAVFFYLGGLATLGLPGMSGFVAEFLVFLGAFPMYKYVTLAAITGLVLTATYILRAGEKIFLGPLNTKYEAIGDVMGIEKVHLYTLTFFVILFGLFPTLLINLSNPAVTPLAQKLGGLLP